MIPSSNHQVDQLSHSSDAFTDVKLLNLEELLIVVLAKLLF
jgi:hypothetical protein